MLNMWYCYTLRSINNGRLYVGVTNDLKRRFEEHNKGLGGEYTKNNRPFELIYYEAYLDKKDACAAELFYKSGIGREVFKKKVVHFFETKI